MPGKRISELTALSGAGSANNDDVVIFDADASETKRISRSQLAEGMQTDVQVFSNKTLSLGSNTVTGTTAQFNTALSDNDFATQAGSEALTNKTIALGSNTVTGTTAQFNTALNDNDFATLAGSEVLTNKTIALANNTVNYTQGGVGAATRTVQARLRDSISVKDFGAVGDGVADDTVAVQAALTAVVASGDRLFFPPGTYLCGKLTVTGGFDAFGPATIKLKNATNDNLIANTGAAVDIKLVDLVFDGNQANQTAYASVLNFASVNSLRMLDCEVRNISGVGVDCNPMVGYTAIERCRFDGNKEHSGVLNDNAIFVSIRGDGTDKEQVVSVTNCVFNGTIPSIAGRGAGGLIVTNLSSAPDNESGPKCTITGNSFFNCGQDAATNRVAAIALYRVAPFSFISENRIFDCDEKGIDIQGCEAPIITSNFIDNTTSSGIDVTTRDLTYETERTIIANNVLRNIGAAAIRCQGFQPSVATPTAKDVVISGNVIDTALQGLIVSDWLGSRNIVGNTFRNLTSTGTSDDAPITIIGSRDAGDQNVLSSVVFANNQIDTMASLIRIAELVEPVIVSGNTIQNVTNQFAIYCFTVDRAVTITNNSFYNCTGFINVQICAHASITGNVFEDSATVIRGVIIQDMAATSLTVCNDNVFKNCANDIVAYDTALGRNMLSNNISDATGTIRIVGGSVVTQSDNLFT
jgi:hypothetical protein